jgi:hypothetical protein
MKEFTGYEYLLIDAANAFGHDKLRYEDRIDWASQNLADLEGMADGINFKDKPLYLKACSAIRKAQAGKPTGHLVGFDAVCSGMQIMSATTGCIAGATATGLVDLDRRADAYTDCTGLMVDELGHHIPGERDKVKQAVMTSLYGSKKEPQKEFGEDTPELEAFKKAMMKLAPGACELLQDLMDSWQAFALVHQWPLPDGYLARVRVMQRKEHRIAVDELGKASFTYVYYENEGEENGIKNVANVVHSMDAYLLRSLIRRCNYDRDLVELVYNCITDELMERSMGIAEQLPMVACTEEIANYIERYESSGMADVVIVPFLDRHEVKTLSTAHLRELNQILTTMLEHKPFEIITVHDEFKCHANNMNWLRKHYRNILADLADSEILSDIFTQLHGKTCTYQKKSQGLSTAIRLSNYAIC